MSRIPPRLVNAYISGLPIRATNCLLRPSAQLLRPIAAPSASRHHQRTLTSSTPLREDEDDKLPIRRTVAQRWAAVSEPVIPLRKVIQYKHDEIGIARAKNAGKEATTAAKAEEEAIKAERELVQREKAAVKEHLELLQETGSKEPLGHWSPTFLLTPEAAQAAAEAKLDAAIAELEAARAAAKVAAIAASEAGVEAAILELETAKAEKEKAKEKAKAAAKAAVKAEKEAAEAYEKSLKKTASQETLKDWECTIGIEIHAQLNTAKKLFSSSRNVTGEGRGPNTELSFFDLALPGSQPQFQKETLIPALRAALALDCDINKESGWDRKHYFHWDQPNGYQITQFFKPFAQNGSITLYPHDGIAPQDIESAKKTKNQGVKVNIKQIQMEQDTAGTITKGEKHYINFNRVGKPLIEIITGPDIHYPSTAAALVRKIQTILNSVDACTLGMEQGGLRADVNVSVRRRGELGTAPEYNGVNGLGTRTEIKNLSSFKSIRDAIIVERNRQVEVLESGGVVEGETRGFNIGDTHTTRLRGKEGEVDYRYMPDPDLPPLIIGQDLIEHLRETMGVLPDEQLEELTRGFGLSIKDALSLVSLDDGYRAEYFYSVLDELAKKFAEPNPQGPPEGSSVIEEWKRAGWTEWYQARLARSEPWFSSCPSPSNSEIVKKPEFQRDAEWDKKFGAIVANWVLHELGGLTSRLGEDGEAMDGVLFDQSYRGRCMVRPKEVAELIRLLEVGRITRKTGKYVLGELYRMGVEIFEEKKEEGVKRDWTKGLPSAVEVIDKEELWFKRMTAEEYEVLARETEEERLWKDILGENRKRAEGKIQYWIGMMMRVAGDRCDAKEARRVIDGLVEEKKWESGKFEVEKERKEVEGLRKKLVEMGRVVNRRAAELEREEKDEEEGEEEEK